MFTNKFRIPINNTFHPNTWESLLWKSNKMHVFDFLSTDILIVGFKNIKRQLRVLVEIETKQNSFLLRKRRENVFLVCDSSNTELVSVCLESTTEQIVSTFQTWFYNNNLLLAKLPFEKRSTKWSSYLLCHRSFTLYLLKNCLSHYWLKQIVSFEVCSIDNNHFW